jgi:hypothetical protein
MACQLNFPKSITLFAPKAQRVDNPMDFSRPTFTLECPQPSQSNSPFRVRMEGAVPVLLLLHILAQAHAILQAEVILLHSYLAKPPPFLYQPAFVQSANLFE